MRVRDLGRPNAAALIAVVVCCVAAYLAFYGWHQFDGRAAWQDLSVLGVLAVVGVWTGWYGLVVSGSVTAAVAMTAMAAIDGATASSHVDGVSLWPGGALYTAVSTAVEVLVVAGLVNVLRRRYYRTARAH